jgi:hypothetical protein
MSDMTAINQQLMNIFGFTEADLQANRAGQLTQQQRARLKRAEEGDPRVLGCAALVIVGMGAVGFAICGTLFNLPVLLESLSVLVIPVLVILGLIVLGIIYAQVRGQRERATKAAALPPLSYSDGPLLLLSGQSPSMMVGAEGFELTNHTYERLYDLPQTALYRVYYASQSQSVLSMEALEET